MIATCLGITCEFLHVAHVRKPSEGASVWLPKHQDLTSDCLDSEVYHNESSLVHCMLINTYPTFRSKAYYRAMVVQNGNHVNGDGSSSKKLDFIIVGGSLGGLATALALQSLGHDTTILERNSEPLLHNQVSTLRKLQQFAWHTGTWVSNDSRAPES